MNFIISLFNTFLYEPLFNALILLYIYFPGGDFGIAVVVLTVGIRILLYPLMMKSIKSQKALTDLQPKMKEIQEKHKNNKEKQAKELMAFYKKEGINPISSFLPILLQLPILIALYRVFWTGLKPEAMIHLYSFIPDPSPINATFLSLFDLSSPNFLIAILAGVTQFYQTKMMTNKKKKEKKEGDKTSQFSDMMQKQMLYFFPIIIIIILLNAPSALGVYLIITSLFSIWQQRRILDQRGGKEETQH